MIKTLQQITSHDRLWRYYQSKRVYSKVNEVRESTAWSKLECGQLAETNTGEIGVVIHTDRFLPIYGAISQDNPDSGWYFISIDDYVDSFYHASARIPEYMAIQVVESTA